MVTVISRPDNAVSAIKLGYPVQRAITGRETGPFINWGCSEIRGIQSCGSHAWLNPTAMLIDTINKGEYLKLLSSVAGVNVPVLRFAGENLEEGDWVARAAFHAEGSGFSLVHSDGRHFTVAEDHATRFIHNTREYRLWFFQDGGDCSFKTAQRIPRTSEGQTESDPCRSKWGYQFRDNFTGAVTMATKALEAVPLNFGAFDMLWAVAERKWYILEVNSAPSLDHEKVRGFFKPHFERWVAANQPEPPAIVAVAEDPIEEVAERRGNVLRVRTDGGKWIEIDLSRM